MDYGLTGHLVSAYTYPLPSTKLEIHIFSELDLNYIVYTHLQLANCPLICVEVSTTFSKISPQTTIQSNLKSIQIIKIILFISVLYQSAAPLVVNGS